MRVSNRFCTVGDGVRQIREDFEDWSPDAQYAHLLADVAVVAHEPVELVTKTMPTGTLRNVHQTDGLVGSHVYLSAHIPESRWMVYAVVDYSERGAEVVDQALKLTPKQRVAEQAMVSRVRAILEEGWEGVL